MSSQSKNAKNGETSSSAEKISDDRHENSELWQEITKTSGLDITGITNSSKARTNEGAVRTENTSIESKTSSIAVLQHSDHNNDMEADVFRNYSQSKKEVPHLTSGSGMRSQHFTKCGSSSEIQIHVLFDADFKSEADVDVMSDVPECKKNSPPKKIKAMNIFQLDENVLVAEKLQFETKNQRQVDEIIVKIVYECLNHASRKMKKESIQFKRIFKEMKGYSRKKMANAVSEGIFHFTCEKDLGSLKDIYIVESDQEMLDNMSKSLKFRHFKSMQPSYEEMRKENLPIKNDDIVGEPVTGTVDINPNASGDTISTTSTTDIGSYMSYPKRKNDEVYIPAISRSNSYRQANNKTNDIPSSTAMPTNVGATKTEHTWKGLRTPSTAAVHSSGHDNAESAVDNGSYLKSKIDLSMQYAVSSSIPGRNVRGYHFEKSKENLDIQIHVLHDANFKSNVDVVVLNYIPKDRMSSHKRSIKAIDGVQLDEDVLVAEKLQLETKNQRIFDDMIVKIVYECLNHASRKMKKVSILFKTIFKEVKGYSKKKAANAMSDGIFHFTCENDSGSLKEIYIVDSDQEMLDSISKSLKLKHFKMLENINLNQGGHSISTTSTFYSGSKKSSRLADIEMGSPPVKVCVREQSIIDVDADIIVVPRSSHLVGGMVAKIIERAGGPTVKMYCKEIMKRRNEEALEVGDVRVTKAGTLPFEAIINVVSYPKDGPPGEKLIEAVTKIVQNCLELADKIEYASIAIPGISAGDAHHAKDDIVEGMICAIIQFCEGTGRQYLKKIILVDVNKEQIRIWKKYLILFTSKGDYDNHEKESTTYSMIATGQHDTMDVTSPFENMPEHWSPMKPKEEMLLVDIKTTDPQFQEVVNSFNNPSELCVSEIKRVQNKTLYIQYMAKKAEMEKTCSLGTAPDMALWHGTSKDAIPNINKKGFNRSYSGKNATQYGSGVYFAADSSYSTQNRFSVPCEEGLQYIYRAKVLTGEYTQGKKHMIEPPLKYDSVVDDPSNPKKFVIFYDAQAYPEYIITFKKNKL